MCVRAYSHRQSRLMSVDSSTFSFKFLFAKRFRHSLTHAKFPIATVVCVFVYTLQPENNATFGCFGIRHSHVQNARKISIAEMNRSEHTWSRDREYVWFSFIEIRCESWMTKWTDVDDPSSSPLFSVSQTPHMRSTYTVYISKRTS